MYFFTWCVARIIGNLPDFVLSGFSWTLAVLSFDILRIRRSLICGNVRKAFPNLADKDIERIGRKSMWHFVATMFETIQGGPKDLLRHVNLSGKEYLDEAIAKDQGVFIVSLHMGNFEVLGGYLSTHFRPMTVPVKYVGQGGFDHYVHSQRQRYNIIPVRRTTKGSGFRAIKEALAKKQLAGFMLDQARHGEPRLPFFGVEAKTNTSIAAIWDKCPVPMLVIYSVRTGFARHQIYVGPEIKRAVPLENESYVTCQSIEYNRIVEGIVRQHPEQYWWLHNRWK